MNTSVEQQQPGTFVDRRGQAGNNRPAGERRQFSSSATYARPAVAELAAAVDQYKLQHRRRFVTFDELFDIFSGLGYTK